MLQLMIFYSTSKLIINPPNCFLPVPKENPPIILAPITQT
ncbi:hypothetical protein O53_3793 [Microcystis aeruginosa TAIHU98]|uniref:Uncharacterized protein n=1 Tax=Microcystis aeruginosa TAIHU98 TaxID=1134457 RepID=L7E674_MICAE|nr:hypothetical protein O53_3793 [Microcystis aeruginosa TAIHU98]